MGKLNLPEEIIIRLYHNENLTQKQIADICHCSPATVKRKIEGYYKGKKRVYKKSGRDRIELPIKEIYEKNKSGVSKEQLAREYHCSPGTIKNRIKEYEISRKGGRKPIILPMYQIVKKYESGENMEDLASQYNISYDTLLRRLEIYYKSKGEERPNKYEINKKRSAFRESLKSDIDEKTIVENVMNNNSKCTSNKDTEVEK